MTLTAPVHQPLVPQQSIYGLLPEGRYQLRRDELGFLHRLKTRHSGSSGERGCGTCTRRNAKHVAVRLVHRKSKKARARWKNLQRSSSYTCPYSNFRKQMEHREDAAFLAVEHVEAGGTLIAGTMTMQSAHAEAPRSFYSQREAFRTHYKRNEEHGSFYEEQHAFPSWLNENPQGNSWDGWDVTRRLDAVNEGIDRMFGGGKPWQRNRAEFGIIGRILAVEPVFTPTYFFTDEGEERAGWGKVKSHIHVHFLLFSTLDPAAVTSKRLRLLLASLHGRWEKGMQKHGFHSSLSAQKLVKVRSDVEDAARQATYIAKGLALLTASSRDLDAATDTADFFQPLRDADSTYVKNGRVFHGDRQARAFWQNLEGAFMKRHFFRISPTLSARYDLKQHRQERKDEYAREVEAIEDLCFIEVEERSRLMREQYAFETQLLNLAENEGADAVREHLSDLGIAFIVPELRGTDIEPQES